MSDGELVLTGKDEERLMKAVKRLLQRGFSPDDIAAESRHVATFYITMAHRIPERTDLQAIRERFPREEGREE